MKINTKTLPFILSISLIILTGCDVVMYPADRKIEFAQEVGIRVNSPCAELNTLCGTKNMVHIEVARVERKDRFAGYQGDYPSEPYARDLESDSYPRTPGGAYAKFLLYPGSYAVNVTSQGDALKSVMSGSTDLQEDYLTVHSGEEPEPIEIIVGPKSLDYETKN